MKIRHSFERTSGLVGSSQKEEKKVKAPRKKGVFETRYKEATNEITQERIGFLLDQINKQGEILSNKIDIKELKIYKQLIADFLNETVYNSHKFIKENILDRKGRYRIWGVVKKINQELEILTQEILKKEKDNLKILKSIEEIKGLLLDIVL